MGSGNLAECHRERQMASPWLPRLRREIEHSRRPDFSILKRGPGTGAPLFGRILWGGMHVPGHANLAEYKSGSKGGAPLWRGDIWGGILSGIFPEYILLARRDPARSIVETVLSRKPFLKNLVFSKMWDPGIWQCARERQMTPLGYYAYAVGLSIPGHLIFTILKRGPGNGAPLFGRILWGGECTFLDT